MGLEFYHLSDPASKQYRWPFVYLHGAAEDHCEKQSRENGWEDEASDIFDANEPMPVYPGDYPATLYGMPVVAFVRYTGGRNFLTGRVASPTDVAGFEHAKKSGDWR